EVAQAELPAVAERGSRHRLEVALPRERGEAQAEKAKAEVSRRLRAHAQAAGRRPDAQVAQHERATAATRPPHERAAVGLLTQLTGEGRPQEGMIDHQREDDLAGLGGGRDERGRQHSRGQAHARSLAGGGPALKAYLKREGPGRHRLADRALRSKRSGGVLLSHTATVQYHRRWRA